MDFNLANVLGAMSLMLFLFNLICLILLVTGANAFSSKDDMMLLLASIVCNNLKPLA